MQGFLLSAFIVISFIAYALMQKFGTDIQSPFPPTEESNNTQTVVQPSTTAPSPANSAVIPTSPPVTAQISGQYKNGQYTGDSVDANYGNVQVKAIIANGKITDVQFLDYPHDRSTSQRINSFAMPQLISEAIQAQSANVDAITGASFTSAAFIESLQSALNKAVNS